LEPLESLTHISPILDPLLLDNVTRTVTSATGIIGVESKGHAFYLISSGSGFPAPYCKLAFKGDGNHQDNKPLHLICPDSH